MDGLEKMIHELLSGMPHGADCPVTLRGGFCCENCCGRVYRTTKLVTKLVREMRALTRYEIQYGEAFSYDLLIENVKKKASVTEPPQPSDHG